MTYLNIFLDLAMIGLLGVGIAYAVKLSRQLGEMRAAHAQMERFVFDFNTTVVRAEKSVNNLKSTARSSGDDLEKLIDKGQMLRDELSFLIESADVVANRISSGANQASSQGAAKPAAPKPVAEVRPMPQKTTASPQALAQELKSGLSAAGKAPSAAERELLRALEKLG